MGVRLVTANDDVERHEVLIRVYGISNIKRPFSANDVEFFEFTAEDADSISKDICDRDLTHRPDLMDILKVAKDDFLEDRRQRLGHWIGKPVARCIVKCVWDEAKAIAIEKTRSCTRVLNLCALARYGQVNTDVILTPDEAPPDLATSIIIRSLDSWTHQTLAFARIAGQHITVDEIFHDLISTNTTFQKLFILAKGETLNNFTTSMLRALEWLNQGFKAESRSSKALCLTTALEIMFCRSTDTSKTSEVSESVAHFVANDVDERLIVREEMKKLYSKRSKLVHDGINDFSADDMAKLTEFAFNAFLNVIDQCHNYTTLKELTSEIQRRKLR